ncbi:DNA-methyltransferase [Niallia taxi]|uniref:DNA-methyltransferase n=1 Tax=Niallia taxi TaxID=2499688 RepID=UPI0015F5B306|nr:site-specific DNA-methyltransferase [Niallia taxi]
MTNLILIAQMRKQDRQQERIKKLAGTKCKGAKKIKGTGTGDRLRNKDQQKGKQKLITSLARFRFNKMVNKVSKMDCRLGLKMLPDECIDLVVTDPAYKVISGGKPDKSKGAPSGMLSLNDGKIFRHNEINFSEWLTEVYRVLKDQSHCYIFTNFLNLKELMDEALRVGFKAHNLLIWEKNNATPNKWYMKNCEYVLMLYKGKAKFINHCGSKTVHQFNNVRNKQHPCEKPEDLIQFYIENSSKEGDVICDPFAGVNGFALAALKSNRQFIGFEIDEEYYRIGQKRINDYHLSSSKVVWESSEDGQLAIVL